MPVSFIKHKGKDILYVDRRGCKDQQIVDNFEKYFQLVKGHEGSDIVSLYDWRDNYLSTEIMKLAKSDEAKDWLIKD